MAKDNIEYTDVVIYADTIGGVDSEEITVTLSKGIVQYKTNVAIRAKKVISVPEIDGKITMTLPDTDNMDGAVYYTFDFRNGVKYKAKVPVSATPIDFWDLELEINTNKEFQDLLLNDC